MVRRAIGDQRPVRRRRIAEVDQHLVQRVHLHHVVLHLPHILDAAARRAVKAFPTEAEARVRQARLRVRGHVEAQQVHTRRHRLQAEDLVRDEPRLIAIEVDPGVQHTRHRRGHFDRGPLASDERSGEHHSVLVVEPVAVVAARGDRRLAVHIAIDAAAQIHGRVDAVGSAALARERTVGGRRVAEIQEHGIQCEDLYRVVLHLTRYTNVTPRRSAKALGAETEPRIRPARLCVDRHVEAQQVRTRRHRQEVEDLVRDEPRLVAVEVDPSLQHARHGRGHLDGGQLAGNERSGEHHAVLVVESVAVVADCGNRRLTIHLTVNTTAQIDGRVDAVGRTPVTRQRPVGGRCVAVVHLHRVQRIDLDHVVLHLARHIRAATQGAAHAFSAETETCIRRAGHRALGHVEAQQARTGGHK